MLNLTYSLSVPLQGVGTLQEVQVPIISQSSCQEMYRTEQVDILYDMICAGFQEGGKDSCQVLLDQLFGLLCLHSQMHDCIHKQKEAGSISPHSVPKCQSQGTKIKTGSEL